MFILQPDINISLFRGGSWSIPPSEATGNSYYVGSSLTNNYERADLFGTVEHYRDSILVNDWAAGSYVIDDVVRYGTSLFKCVADTSDVPNKNVSTPWLWVAYSNKYNTLDGILESRSYGYTSTLKEFQDWSMQFRTSATMTHYDDSASSDGTKTADNRNTRMTTIAIMNLYEVDSVRITVKRSDNVTIEYDETHTISSSYSTTPVGWTAYYDAIKESATNSEIGSTLVVNFKAVGNGYVNIEFNASSERKMRGVGAIFTGYTETIGTANWGSGFDITQFSKFEQDEFGTSSIVERGYKNNFTYSVIMDTANLAPIRRSLNRNRAYPCVYIGDYKQEITINYGVFSDISPDLTYNKTLANLEIKGF